MSPLLTQSEEIEQALKDFGWDDTKVAPPSTGSEYSAKLCGQASAVSLNGASTSPYRDAYLKSHNLPG